MVSVFIDLLLIHMCIEKNMAIKKMEAEYDQKLEAMKAEYNAENRK